ncbi:MAG: hypothetical protein M1608_04575 [Candidatus Omnitrophica bacterium]|nr:hypothetical protein [Candidatus Omnitrophota bacterium]
MDTNQLSRPKFEGVLESITVRTNGPDLLIEMPVPRELEGYADNAMFDYHHIAFGNALECPEGRVWLDHVAVAFGSFPADKLNEYSVRLPARFYDRQLKAVSSDRVPEFARQDWYRTLDFRGLYPAVSFGLRGELRQEAKVLAFHAFDARTHESLDSGYSWGGDLAKDGVNAKLDLQLWHAAPVLLVVDMSLGPAQVIEFPAQVGSTAKFPEGELQLVVKADDMENRSTSHSDKITLKVEPKAYNREPKTTCMIFACLPKAYSMPLDFEYQDEQGQTLKSQGGGTSSFFINQTVMGEASRIRSVRVRYYPNRKRLVFHLPRIPGLPEPNRNVKNLFDVRLPFVRISRDYEFRDLITHLTQMQFSPQAGGALLSLADPITYNNITVKELLEKYAQLSGPTYGAEIDQERLTIQIVDQSLNARAQRFFDCIKKRFH